MRKLSDEEVRSLAREIKRRTYHDWAVLAAKAAVGQRTLKEIAAERKDQQEK